MGIVGADSGARRPQRLHQDQAGCFPHVIGIGLECQSPEGEGFARQLTAKVATDLLEENVLLPVIDVIHRPHQFGIVANLLRGADQCVNVLGKAGPAIAAARIDEGITDARIRTNPHAHLLDISAVTFRDVGQLVHEADLRRQHDVGRVLGEFRRAHIHDDEFVVTAAEGLVKLAEQLRCAVTVSPDDDAVRFHEVSHRGSLFQELRVRDHIEGHG